MARSEDLLYSPTTWSVIATATNGISTATKAAAAGFQHFITGYSISASGIVAAAVAATVADGATVLDRIEIPAAAFAPIIRNYARPLRCTGGNKAEAVLPALGGGIVGTIVLFGFTASL